MANAATKPVMPGARKGINKGADESGTVKAARDKLRTRERQSTFVAGQLAMRIENQTPGRIHCIKVSTTRYKCTTVIVFDRSQRVRAPEPAEYDPYDSDDDGDGEESKGPKTKPLNADAAKPAPPPSTAPSSKGAGQQGGTQGAWQAPRKPARQQPSPAAPPAAAKQVAKVGRNDLSARSGEKRPAAAEKPKVLVAKQLAAMANSINQISKEVCPPSTFTVKRNVPVDGAQVEVNLVPTCRAAEIGRQNPILLGSQLKECWLRSDGSTVREMLTPKEPPAPSVPRFKRPAEPPRPKSPMTSEPPPPAAAGAEGMEVEHPAQSKEELKEDEGFDLFD